MNLFISLRASDSHSFPFCKAESGDFLEETCGGGQQVEAGLYPQTQSSKYRHQTSISKVQVLSAIDSLNTSSK